MVGTGDATLTIYGSGHTYTLHDTADPDTPGNPDISEGGQISYDEAVRIDGNVEIESGTAGSGYIKFLLALDGDGIAGDDNLILNAADGVSDIFFRDTVGGVDPLESLTIIAAHNVTFDHEVIIDGDLYIAANGKVTFHQAVTIGEGGSLTITGASEVVFEEASSLIVDQDITIEADEIDFQGGDYSISSTGNGSIILMPATVGTPIEISSPPDSVPTGNLNLTVSDIRAISGGFSVIVIGRKSGDHAEAGTGAVRIGVGSQFGYTFLDPLEIYGGSIAVVDYPDSNYVFKTNSTVTLDAVGNITISNEFRPGGDLTLYSEDGKIRQLQGDLQDADFLTAECIIGGNLIATAQTGIDLQWTRVSTLDVLNTGSGDISINEVAAGGDVAVKRLEQSGAGDNDIDLTAENGTITILGGETGVKTVAGSGAITLDARGTDSDVLVNEVVTSNTGTITIDAADTIRNTAVISSTGAAAIDLNAGDNVDQDADITSAGGQITVDAAAGDIDMNDGTITSSSAGSGNIVYTAETDVKLSIVHAATTVQVTAGTGSITEQLSSGSEDSNILGTTVTLSAATGIGTPGEDIDTNIDTLIATNSTSGGIFIHEADDLTVGEGGSGVSTLAGNGSIVIRTVDGTVTVAEEVSANGSGNIRIEGVGAGRDVVLNEVVKSGTGNITVIAAGACIQNATGDMRTGGAGTVDVQAIGGAITMADGAEARTGGGSIRYEAHDGIVLGLLDARTAADRAGGTLAGQASWGSVSVTANGGSITDAGGASVDVYANLLRMSATGDIGTLGTGATNAIETEAKILAARSLTDGELSILEATDVAVGPVPALTVARVDVDATTDDLADGDFMEGLTSSSGGGIVLRTAAGTIAVDRPVSADGAGNVLIQSQGVLKNVDLNALVESGSGNISIMASGSVLQDANIVTTGGGGTIDVAALGGSITMADGYSSETTDANIRLYASQSITLGQLVAGNGHVSIHAVNGNVTDADEGIGNDVTSDTLRITAGGDIGSGTDPIETTVNTLAADASGAGGMFLVNSTSVEVAGVGLVTAHRVQSDGTVADVEDDSDLSDLTTRGDGGTIVLVADTGSVVVSDGVDGDGRGVDAAGAGNVHVESRGVGNDVTLSVVVVSGSGHITVLSSASVAQNADISTAGTVCVQAANGVTMADGVVTSTAGGHVRYEAASGDVTLGEISAGAGHVAVIAVTGSIVDHDDAGAVDVIAAKLTMSAGTDIGAGDNHIETTVATLSALAGGANGLFVTETDGVDVAEVAVNVYRIDSDGAVPEITTDYTVSDLEETGSGHVVLVAGSDITVSDGGDADGIGVNTVGTGNVLIHSTGGSVVIAGDVGAGGGNVSVIGEVDVTQSADIRTSVEAGAGGTIDVEAVTGVIVMDDGTVTSTTDANIRYRAAGTLTVGAIDAGTAWVSLKADGITDSGTTDTDVAAARLRIETTDAAGGAGGSDNHLEVSVGTLSADVDAGGLFLTEADDVTIATVSAVTVSRVGSDGATLTDTTDGAQSDVTSGGAVVVETSDGSLTVEGGGDTVGVTAAGNILLRAGEEGEELEDHTDDITLSASVTSSGGHISLDSADGIVQGADGDILTEAEGATIDLVAGDEIDMDSAAEATSTNGHVRYEAATGDVTLGTITAGSGTVAVIATAGSIRDLADAGAVDVIAAKLTMSAGTDIGAGDNHIETTVATLSALAGGANGLFVTETDGVDVAEVAVNVYRIDSDGAVPANTTDYTLSDLSETGEGWIVLVAGVDIVVTDGGDEDGIGVCLVGSGSVLLHSTWGDVSITGDVEAGGGNVSVIGEVDVTQSADIRTSVEAGTSGTIDVEAVTGVIVMDDGTVTSTTDADIRYRAAGTLTVGSIDAGTASVSLKADGITDSGTTDTDVTAARLRIETTDAAGGAGEGDNHLETSVTTLSADVDAGGLFLTDADDVSVTTVAEVTVKRVGSDGATLTDTTDGAQSDVTSGGAVVVETSDGSLTVEGGGDTVGVTAAGNILFRTGEEGEELEDHADDITLNASVSSTGGHISLNSADGIVQGAEGDITAQAEGTTIDLLAGDEIDMDMAAEATSTNGHIRYEAVTGDVTLGTITAGSGNVAVISTAGSIRDLDDADAVDIIASDLILIAGGDIGIGTNHIETHVAVLSSRTGGANGMFVTESDEVSIDDVTVSVNRIAGDGATPAVTTDKTLSDLTSSVSDDSRIILSAGGDITVYNTAGLYGVDARGNVLLESAGDIVLENNATVLSRKGNISIVAAKGVEHKGDADILAYHGTIDVEAGDGDIVMAAGTMAASYYYYGPPGESDTHNIRYEASGTVKLAGIDAGNGDVSIVAGGDITDNGDDNSEVTADELRMVAGGNIGEPHLTNRGLLELTVNELAAQSDGDAGIFVVNTRSVSVAEVGTVIVNRVDTAGGIGDRADAGAVSDVVSLSNTGTIVLLVSGGDLTVTDGGDGDGVGISARGSGNILLNAQETGGTMDIQSNADILTATGHITLSAGLGITLGADVDVTSNDASSAGTLDIFAGTGSFVMDETATLQTTAGDMRIRVGDDVLDQVVLGDVTASNANVSIETSGSVLDTADEDNEVTARGLRIVAGKGVGLSAGNSLDAAVNAIETSVGTLSIRVQGSDGVNIFENDALTIGNVVSLLDTSKSVAVDTVNADATVTRHTEAIQSDVVTTNANGDNGSIVIRVGTGNLTLNDGTAPVDNTVIRAHGSGNILLETLSGSITANGDIHSGSGHITVLASDSMECTAGADITTGETGTIDLEATSGSILLSTTSNQTTGSGDVRFLAYVNITLGGVTHTTGSVSVTADTGWIHDGDTDGSVDIEASGLRLDAAVEVGQLGGSVNPIETTVTTVSARAGAGGISLLESDDLIVDDTTVTINRVDIDATTDGVTDTRTDAVQSDVVTTADSDGSIVVRLVDGDLTLNDGTAPADADGRAVLADGTGNILLETIADAKSVTVNADVESEGGHISIVAGSGITFTAGADIDTVGAGTIDLEARTGSILLSTTSDQTTGSGDIRFFAHVNVTLGGLVTHTTGSVSVTADTGWIHDGDSDGSVDIEATGLRLDAAVEVGQLGVDVNPIETTVTTVSARAGAGGLNLLESDDLVVDDTTVTINRVDIDATTDGETDIRTDAVRSDLVTTDGSDGSIVVRLVNGDLTLNNGTAPADADGRAVLADGTGNILLETIADAKSVTANADVESEGGHISIVAGDGITFTAGADIDTVGTGTIDLDARTGSITC